MKKIFASLLQFAIIAIGFFKKTQPTQVEEQKPKTLEEALAKGFVHIDHPKLKGGRSEHIATRNAGLIPKANAPKGNEAKPDTLPYFATDVNGWRSLSTADWVLGGTKWTYLGTQIPA